MVSAIGINAQETLKGSVKQVAAGDNHSLILMTDGTLWASGENEFGQIGYGTTTNRNSPVQVADGVKSVSAGGSSTFVVKNDGSLWACGYNSYGQLGDGTTSECSTLKYIMNNVDTVASGTTHTMILKKDGSLWACGYNAYGRLGDGTTEDKPIPVKVMEGVVSVSTSNYHTLILKSDGTLWACGLNSTGQLGDGTTTNRRTPKKIMSDVVTMQTGSFHSLILKSDSTLWSCGRNEYGELGDGTTTRKTSPVKIMDYVAHISTSKWHSMIVKNDGTLWACGWNLSGQLGDGTTTDRKAPVHIMDDVKFVATGESHSLMLKTDGTLWATGDNEYGQLCNGTNTSVSNFVLIGEEYNAIEPEDSSTKEAYAVLDNGGETVTFFYDSRKGSRGGININNNYSANPYPDAITAIFDASFADYRPTSTAYWFYNCNTLTTVKGIENLRTDNVTDMNCMFFGCSNLTSLDLSSFNTSNVTDMSRMFRGCNSLAILNINGFKTDNVTDMNSMFYHCYALKSLDLSSFSTHNVTDMYSMFGGCTGLTIIDINSFKTDNVTRMSFMFEGCTNLQTIYASDDWSTEKVTSGTSMFRNCTNLFGGQGTTFDASHTNHTYARIDGGSSYPGYFTRKNTDIAIDEINFPDENFRNHLLSQNYGADKVISKEELSMITSMSVEGKNISNLSGIELFTYLEILNCFGNQLRNLDLSGNKNLRYLMCCYNKLTTIDLSNNINIEQIRCDNNIIKGSGLDAMINSLPQNTSNTKRFILLVDNSNNTEENTCSRAQSSVIKEKGWKVYYYNGSDNDMNGWVELEDSEATDVVVINEENIPDPIFRNFLLEQDYGKSGVLLPDKLAEVKKLDVSGKGISDLKGIEYFSALEWLRCDGNSLTTLDVSKNLSLQSLWCHNNRIVKLVLPNSSTLKTVLCSRNRISGSAMDKLISNLPDNWTSEEHNIAVVDYSKNDEENICTNSQVTQIKNKGWNPQYLETSDNSLSGGDYEGNEITIMTSNSGYATFYARNFTYSLPNELSALVPSGIKNNKLTYTSLNSTVVPNGTPVILVSNVKTAKAYTLTITGTSPYYSGTNLLCGSDEATTTFGNGYHYKLSYGMSGTSLSDVFGWYWGADNGGSFMTEGHKAWLVVPKSAGTTRGFTVDDETTGISTLEVSEEEAVYYDLQGRRVMNPTVKGVYIKNGKKVMVK